jgi:hypothetical protein
VKLSRSGGTFGQFLRQDTQKRLGSIGRQGVFGFLLLIREMGVFL